MNKYVPNKEISNRIFSLIKTLPKTISMSASSSFENEEVHIENTFYFTVGQLNEIIYKNIPNTIDIYIYVENDIWCVGYYNNIDNTNSELIMETTEADAKGKLLLLLIENDIIKIESIKI